MPRFHVFIATSLDGFIARPDGAIDWLLQFPSDGDNGYGEFISGMDAIVMGRATYETVRGFGEWPYTLPVVVLSGTLPRGPLPDLSGVEVMADSPEALAATLDVRGWKNVYVDGGTTVQGFLAAGLIDRMSVFRMPVLIGEGIPLFGPTGRDIPVHLEGVSSLSNGAVRSDYRLESGVPR